ncbi:type II secretion system F family protein [Geodermatophilus sp. SYSU D00758]
MAERTSLEPLARFVDGLLVALERGTPLAEVLRAQAADAREAGKRLLLEAGGRKEIAMMVPVVFLVLPVTVLFALCSIRDYWPRAHGYGSGVRGTTPIRRAGGSRCSSMAALRRPHPKRTPEGADRRPAIDPATGGLRYQGPLTALA